MSNRWGTVPLAAVVVLAVAGCSGPQKDASYKSIADLKSAIEQVTGEQCKDGLGDASTQKYGWDQGTCGPNDMIAVFASAAKESDIVAGNRESHPSYTWVSGNLWSYATPDKSLAAKVQAAMGGTLH